MEVVARCLAGLAGAAVVLATGLGVIRTFVLPRARMGGMVRLVSGVIHRVFWARARRRSDYLERDRAVELFAPTALLALPMAWVAGVILGFAGLLWATGTSDVGEALRLSGSSITTLGFVSAEGDAAHVLAVIEAVIGLGLVALVLSYLPGLYGEFQRRELPVEMLEVRAGDPPFATEMLRRHHAVGRLEAAASLFESWEAWFADIEETHTSQPLLAFFRSPVPGRSWITAAGAVLDAAALMQSTLATDPMPQAALCLRAGGLSLGRIATSFGVPHEPDPAPDAPVAVTREEFDEACADLSAAGLSLRDDRDAAWAAFRGWRVNYDTALVGLCGVVMAPFAPWSSDRSLSGAWRPDRPFARRS